MGGGARIVRRGADLLFGVFAEDFHGRRGQGWGEGLYRDGRGEGIRSGGGRLVRPRNPVPRRVRLHRLRGRKGGAGHLPEKDFGGLRLRRSVCSAQIRDRLLAERRDADVGGRVYVYRGERHAFAACGAEGGCGVQGVVSLSRLFGRSRGRDRLYGRGRRSVCEMERRGIYRPL